MASSDRIYMQKHVKKQPPLFFLFQLQHIINIDTRKIFYDAHIKPHIGYASVVWNGCGEVHLKKTELLYRKGNNKMSTLGILNLPQQLTYNKGVFMHKVLNNNSPNYLAQLFTSRQSCYTNCRNNLYVPRPRLDLFKTKISFAGASLWNFMPQKITPVFLFLVSNVICTNICLRMTSRQIWTDLFESPVCLNI